MARVFFPGTNPWWVCESFLRQLERTVCWCSGNCVPSGLELTTSVSQRCHCSSFSCLYFSLFIYSFPNCLSFKISYFFPLFFFLLFFSCLLFPCIGQLFLKEDVYQLLECKRQRTRQLAALTLQRYARMFFIRKRFLAFRKKIVTLQAQCRGFLTRSARPVSSE